MAGGLVALAALLGTALVAVRSYLREASVFFRGRP